MKGVKSMKIKDLESYEGSTWLEQIVSVALMS